MTDSERAFKEHLRHGEFSPRALWQAAWDARGKRDAEIVKNYKHEIRKNHFVNACDVVNAQLDIVKAIEGAE